MQHITKNQNSISISIYAHGPNIEYSHSFTTTNEHKNCDCRRIFNQIISSLRARHATRLLYATMIKYVYPYIWWSFLTCTQVRYTILCFLTANICLEFCIHFMYMLVCIKLTMAVLYLFMQGSCVWYGMCCVLCRSFE